MLGVAVLPVALACLLQHADNLPDRAEFDEFEFLSNLPTQRDQDARHQAEPTPPVGWTVGRQQFTGCTWAWRGRAERLHVCQGASFCWNVVKHLREREEPWLLNKAKTPNSQLAFTIRVEELEDRPAILLRVTEEAITGWPCRTVTKQVLPIRRGQLSRKSATSCSPGRSDTSHWMDACCEHVPVTDEELRQEQAAEGACACVSCLWRCIIWGEVVGDPAKDANEE